MTELLPHIIALSLIWFFIYWIVGGVLFAIIALFRVTKLNRFRFSCLFTFLSMCMAFLAVFSSSYLAKQKIDICLNTSDDVFESLASVLVCGVFEHAFMGLAGFLLLMILGFISYYLSLAGNQSWMDSEEGDMSTEHFANLPEA